MSQSHGNQMDSSKPTSIFLRSTSGVSLNERFSQVLVDRLTQSRVATFNPVLPQQRRVCAPPPVVLLMKRETSSLPSMQTQALSVRVKQHLRRRKSVWTRLGWQQATRRFSASRPRGFWSFRHKYRWRARFTSIYKRRDNLRGGLGQRGLLMKRNIQRVATGRMQLRLHLPRGGATTSRRRGLIRDDVPTKEQLDAQLEDYMSMSRRRLDAQLDEYMSMAGQTYLD